MIFQRKSYRAEISPSGVISGLYPADRGAEIDLSAGAVGALCLTASDRLPRFRRRYQDGIQPFDVPLKEFVTVQDFTPECRCTAAGENSVSFQYGLYNAEVDYRFEEDGLRIHASARDERIVQFGLRLPLLFPGAEPGSLPHQLMPSSPYTSSDGSLCFFLIPLLDGGFLLITSEGRIDGWKLEYSEYNYGHFILDLKMLEQFDACYQPPHSSAQHEMALWLDFPADLDAAFSCVSRRAGCPCASLAISGGALGMSVPFRVFGDCAKAVLCAPSGREQMLDVQDSCAAAELTEPGFHRILLYSRDGRSYDFDLFGYRSLQELWLRSMLCVRKPYHIDENLAEGGAWCWAMLSYLRIYGPDARLLPAVTEFLEQKLLTTDPQRVTARCTLWPYPQTICGHEYGPWHIWQSTRVQEQFFGISILLEACRALHRDEYLEYAVLAAESLLRDHISEGGQIWRFDERGSRVDYTTVCAPVIALVDLTRELEARADARAAQWAAVCECIADYLLRRGFSFSTEADQAYADRELEEGSISCTALSVLYVCRWIRRKDAYLEFAERILALHDAWLCRTQDVRMYRSTFRWWELIWEGDQDGPAICAGHAWTIWRAEADYYMALLTGDCARARDSYCGYLTNYCKVGPDGSMSAAFVVDPLPYRTSEGTLGHRYPEHKDSSLSRYVWARSADTWLTACGVFVSGGHIETIHTQYTVKGKTIRLTPVVRSLRTLFADAGGYTICINTHEPLQLVSPGVIMIAHGSLQQGRDGIPIAAPENGLLEFTC